MTILTYVIRNKTKYIRMTLPIINMLSMFGLNLYVRKVKEKNKLSPAKIDSKKLRLLIKSDWFG